MNVEYIIQPDRQLGTILAELLDTSPKRVVFVSAFVRLQTIMRIKPTALALKATGSEVRFVVGIDLGGTSQEVLHELLGWGIDVRIVKHRFPGHTFHPKLYFFEWAHKATIIIGSNNITEGGFFGNYEVAARINYDLPKDAAELASIRSELGRFINPEGATAYTLDELFYKKLVENSEVPTEEEARKEIAAHIKAKRKKLKIVGAEPLFGVEDFMPPPPLPADLLDRLVKEVRRRRGEHKKSSIKGSKKDKATMQLPINEKESDLLLPAAFYMTLPTLQGDNIPGEGRIPLEAIELAKEFWGWPDEYKKEVSPRAGNERVYWNWRPVWQIWSVTNPADVSVQEVRMYMYENSSDFRFYVRPLVNAGGDLGDVVRIRRIAQKDAEYECVLARQGTQEYDEWIQYCTQAVRNSTRFFGYA
jgi:HKD family nuclease